MNQFTCALILPTVVLVTSYSPARAQDDPDPGIQAQGNHSNQRWPPTSAANAAQCYQDITDFQNSGIVQNLIATSDKETISKNFTDAGSVVIGIDWRW